MKLKNHYYLDQGKTICYAYIRKNACSVFKKLIVDEVAKCRDVHYETIVEAMYHFHVGNVDAARKAPKRIFVIRDPLERVVSGFLNQIVFKIDTPYPEMFNVIKTDLGLDPADLTFHTFVEQYLCGLSLAQINAHFHPITVILGPIEYTHVLWDRYLYEDVALVLGKDTADAYFTKPLNSTSKISNYAADDACLLSARDIFETFKSSGKVPDKGSFLCMDAVQDRLRNAYQRDLELYQSYLKHRRSNRNKPVPIAIASYA